jgi:ubiquinone/menaquinone biosynthesis C-methylase UbiE
MKEDKGLTPEGIGAMYDSQAETYGSFAEGSYSWRFIEKPALIRYLEPLVGHQTLALDVGCGTGRVINLLTDLGVPEQNITGVDVSDVLLQRTAQAHPHATFIHSSVDSFEVPDDSFDVVTANMVFHYLDNETLEQAVERIYKALKPHGRLCFIEPHPLHDGEVVKAEKNNQWLEQVTPWGATIRVFNRDPDSLRDIMELGGFNLEAGWETLPIAQGGELDVAHYERYTQHSSRAGYVWRKADQAAKDRRNDPHYIVPSFTGE